MRISDWSSDVCSSDLEIGADRGPAGDGAAADHVGFGQQPRAVADGADGLSRIDELLHHVDDLLLHPKLVGILGSAREQQGVELLAVRSEEHTSELQSLMRISYAVFCLKKKKIKIYQNTQAYELVKQATKY